MPEVQITSLTRANKNSESLRTTVPSSIIKIFDLKDGDKLRWQIDAVKKNEFTVRLEPVKADKESIGKEGEGGI